MGLVASMGLAAGGNANATARALPAAKSVQDRLWHLLGHQDGATRIAAQCLELGTTAPQAGARLLVALETADFPKLEDTAARACLATRMRADFREGRVHNVRNWRVSDTEIGLAALLAGVPTAAEPPTTPPALPGCCE